MDKERVVDCGPGDAACGTEGSGSSSERGIIKVTKADTDGAVAGGPGCKVGSRKGTAEGMV